MNQINLQNRIGWHGDIKSVLAAVCENYDFGQYKSHKEISIGYEDYNLILTTERGNYFVKIFAKFRDLRQCHRYLEIMQHVIKAGVNHPQLYESLGGCLFVTECDGVAIRLCVLKYIDGQSLYESNTKVSSEEISFIAHQAALINSISLMPENFYDSWAMVNFPAEYSKNQDYLEREDKRLIEIVLQEYLLVDWEKIPKCLVHDDLIKTNIIRGRSGQLYILDCSVAGYYPRVQELAVLFSNVFFDEDNLYSFPQYYQQALKEYQRIIRLTDLEIASLPILVKAAHAMHIIGSTHETVRNKIDTDENKYWLKLGRIGLHYTVETWNR